MRPLCTTGSKVMLCVASALKLNNVGFSLLDFVGRFFFQWDLHLCDYCTANLHTFEWHNLTVIRFPVVQCFHTGNHRGRNYVFCADAHDDFIAAGILIRNSPKHITVNCIHCKPLLAVGL